MGGPAKSVVYLQENARPRKTAVHTMPLRVGMVAPQTAAMVSAKLPVTRTSSTFAGDLAAPLPGDGAAVRRGASEVGRLDQHHRVVVPRLLEGARRGGCSVGSRWAPGGGTDPGTGTGTDPGTGGTPGMTHSLAAAYLGISVAFGPHLVRRADAWFAHRFAGGRIRDGDLPARSRRRPIGLGGGLGLLER